jgi:hypothetical protein
MPSIKGLFPNFGDSPFLLFSLLRRQSLCIIQPVTEHTKRTIIDQMLAMVMALLKVAAKLIMHMKLSLVIGMTNAVKAITKG